MSLRSTFVLCLVLVACVAQERRAMGFVGMRGKKEADETKRAMGFQGMRGKKDEIGGGVPSSGEDLSDLNEIKRAMGFQGMRGKKAMGFMGMRGKKDMDESTWSEEAKRGGSSFFGMRGKKGPNSSAFFGVRGKKGPRGFMGVRGKKDGREDIDSLLLALKETARQEMDEMEDPRARRFDALLGDAFGGYQLPSETDLV